MSRIRFLSWSERPNEETKEPDRTERNSTWLYCVIFNPTSETDAIVDDLLYQYGPCSKSYYNGRPEVFQSTKDPGTGKGDAVLSQYIMGDKSFDLKRTIGIFYPRDNSQFFQDKFVQAFKHVKPINPEPLGDPIEDIEPRTPRSINRP